VSIQTVNEQLNRFYVRERLLASLSGFFGAFAVLLASLGLPDGFPTGAPRASTRPPS
jgi:hypothetical protein